MQPNTTLRAAREAMGYTQTAAAEKCQVSLRTYAAWELGEVPVPAGKLEHALAVLSPAADNWIDRKHPGGWIRGGQRRLTAEMRQLLRDAYCAGRMSVDTTTATGEI